MVTALASCRRTPHRTEAVTSPGKVRRPTAHSSTPVAPMLPSPETAVGSTNGLPAAAPAIARA